jgi:hypothetical protein
MGRFSNLSFTGQLMSIGCLYIIACCGCTFSLFFVEASLREIGVLSSFTPVFTSTLRPFLTNTPIPTSPPGTPTYTPSSTNTPLYTDLFLPAATQTFTPTDQPTATPIQQPAAQSTAQPTAPPAPTTAPVLITLIGLTSPILRNSDATLTIQTNPGAVCDPGVFYASGDSTAAGLEEKTAPPNGTLSWTWRVGPQTKGGAWTVYVECDGNDMSWPFIVEE